MADSKVYFPPWTEIIAGQSLKRQRQGCLEVRTVTRSHPIVMNESHSLIFERSETPKATLQPSNSVECKSCGESFSGGSMREMPEESAPPPLWIRQHSEQSGKINSGRFGDPTLRHWCAWNLICKARWRWRCSRRTCQGWATGTEGELATATPTLAAAKN